MKAPRSAALVIGYFACLCGCGQHPVKITGTMTLDGAPLKLASGECVHMSFLLLEVKPGEEMCQFSAEVNAGQGIFAVKGPSGSGIPQGRYRVCLQITRNREDILNGCYNSSDSPMTCEVSKKQRHFDLAFITPTVSVRKKKGFIRTQDD